jgi:hypothetical protein
MVYLLLWHEKPHEASSGQKSVHRQDVLSAKAEQYIVKKAQFYLITAFMHILGLH